jgi:hypothetical protein
VQGFKIVDTGPTFKTPNSYGIGAKCIIVNPRELCCAFCFRKKKDIEHLFFKCSFSLQLWKTIINWMKVECIPFEEGWQHFISFGALMKIRNMQKPDK